MNKFEEGMSPEDSFIPLDVSEQFLNLSSVDFTRFLRTKQQQTELSISFDWVDVMTARRAKAFLEMSSDGQKRNATIRATRAQYNQEPNVFASGVTWEEVTEE